MRDSVVFYKSFRDAIKRLPVEEQLKAYDAIMDYAFEGIEVEDGIAAAILLMAKPQIDANNQRYENGRKGGRPKTESEPSDNQTETKPKPNHNQTITKPEPNVNVNVNDNDNDLNTCADEPHDKEADLEYNFKILYGMYPKKKGRTVAYQEYKKWVSKEGKCVGNKYYHLTTNQIYRAIKKYLRENEEAGTELQYYKNFDTLLGRQLLDYVEAENDTS